MKKVFVVTYGGGHVNMIIPVVEKLKEKGVEVKVLGLTTAESVLKSRGIESFGYRHYLSLFEEKDHILKQGRILLNDLPPNSEIAEEETVAYLGLSYWSLEQKSGKAKAHEEYLKHGRYCFFQTEVLEKILKFENPDFVLSTTSPRSEMAALAVSKNLGIPNSCIVDQYNAGLYEKRYRETDYVDHYFVPLEFEFKALSLLGINESKISITGNPAFESHLSPHYARQADDFKRVNFPDKKIIISYAKAASYSIYAKADDETIEKVLEYVKEKHECGLIIRNHPNDLFLGEMQSGVFYSTKKENIAMILHASDIVLTQGSTVGIEANILGKVVYQYVDPKCPVPLIDLEEMGIAKKVYSIDGLIMLLKQYIPATNKRFSFDVLPSVKIANYIISRP